MTVSDTALRCRLRGLRGHQATASPRRGSRLALVTLSSCPRPGVRDGRLSASRAQATKLSDAIRDAAIDVASETGTVSITPR